MLAPGSSVAASAACGAASADTSPSTETAARRAIMSAAYQPRRTAAIRVFASIGRGME
jgi:hypothetical protein